jgi:PAS domain S-box-containing protein
MKKLIDLILIRNAARLIHEQDLSARQQFNLFRTLTAATFLISLSITFQVLSVLQAEVAFSTLLCGLTSLLMLNYFTLNWHKQFRFAYWISVISSLAVLHVVTYYSGGIRNSGMVYFGGLILATFMLLGNREGKIISVLSILNLIFFYFYSEFFGRDVRNIIDSDASGSMLNLDYFITYLTATILIYSLSNNLLSNKNVVISKVMESKKDLEHKNEELRKLSLVASKTDNLVLITDASGTIEWVNEGYERCTGYRLEEVKGMQAGETLFDIKANPEIIIQLNRSLEHNESFSDEVNCFTKDGRKIWLSVQATPILDGQGIRERTVYVCSDISDRKEADERTSEYYRYLEKANKELDKFAYVVSHDLKAPLRAISNLSTWIEEDLGDSFSSDTREHFNMLKGRVVRMEGLINGILEYSRADRVKSPNVCFDAREVFDEVFDLLIENNNLNVQLQGQLPQMETERMKFQQVVSNLVSNAIRHNDKPNASLSIEVSEDDQFHLFSFTDNGPGIEAQYHEKIFVIFQTLKARDSFESTGVGLAIVKKIIDEVGGKITVESEAGMFTRFIVYWPKHTEERYKPFQFSLHEGATLNERRAQSLQIHTA